MSQDPENEGRFRADLPIRCHARTALVLAQKVRGEKEDQAPEALLWESPQLAGDVVPDHHDADQDDAH